MDIPGLSVSRESLATTKAGAVALLMTEDKASLEKQAQMLRRLFDGPVPLLGTEAFRGKETEVVVLSPVSLKGRPLIIAGLGASGRLTPERLRRAAALSAKQATRLKVDSLALALPDNDGVKAASSFLGTAPWETVGMALAEGAVLALYSFDKYQTVRQSSPVGSVVILAGTGAQEQQIRTGVQAARIICEGTWFARDLGNAPGNELYPESLAAAARESGRRYGFTVTVFDERRIRQLNMGGVLGVSQGSAKPPRFIALEYGRRRRSGETIVLVGKGVTFDSGGISIKPSPNMAEMKMDMAGAAAALATMQTVARLKLPVHLVCLIPAVENLPGGRALKPGDVLRHFNGKTSEVDNTDAEGRLILADALAYAARYKPALVIDLATLTGAVVIALGHVATGMLGNAPDAMGKLKEAGERTYERVWELPMFEEYEKLIKSDVADVKNIGGRWAGAITAAMFLKQFVGDYPWVHLDIAGTAIIEEPSEYIPKGASGVGVRLLTEFLRQRAGSMGH